MTLMAPNLLTPAWPEPPSFNIAGEEGALRDIMDPTRCSRSAWVTRAYRLRGQELVKARPNVRLAVAAALSRKECERATAILKAAVTKVLAQRK